MWDFCIPSSSVDLPPLLSPGVPLWWGRVLSSPSRLACWMKVVCLCAPSQRAAAAAISRGNWRVQARVTHILTYRSGQVSHTILRSACICHSCRSMDLCRRCWSPKRWISHHHCPGKRHTGVFHCHPCQERILADLDDLSQDEDVLQGLKCTGSQESRGNSTCLPLIWAAVRDVIVVTAPRSCAQLTTRGQTW